MNPRVIILVVIALGAALGTVYMTRSWLDSQRASGGAQPAGPVGRARRGRGGQGLPAPPGGGAGARGPGPRDGAGRPPGRR